MVFEVSVETRVSNHSKELSDSLPLLVYSSLITEKIHELLKVVNSENKGFIYVL